MLEAEVYILWPSFRPNGDPLLYLTGQPLVEGKGRCAFVADVNPYGLEVRYIPIKLHIMDFFEKIQNTNWIISFLNRNFPFLARC